MLSDRLCRGLSRHRDDRSPAARFLRRFGRDDDGSMIIFAMFLLVMMLIVGGMAVDLMRFETNRARLQATLDRAVLAAADLDQTRDPEAVVRDFFQKAGLLDEITSITVTENINSRAVAATAEMDVDTMFMNLVGIENLEAPAAGTAIENISDIEIVLVLDVSGSMGSNNRIVNLRAAAREFVRTILANDDENRISIAIVPFNAQVNLGAVLRARYNVTHLHGVTNSNCIDLPTSVFAAPGLSTALAMPQAGYFDGGSTTTQNTSYVNPQAPDFNNYLYCRLETQNIVRLPQRSITTLENQIQALTANGNTSITLGMKWGMALLDPGSRTMFSALIAAGQIPANLAGRPYDYNRQNTLKVVVLMTDGEHVASTLLDEANLYRTGPSGIWRAVPDNNYSIFHASRVDRTSAATIAASRPFWVPHRSEWHARPWNGTVPPTNGGTAMPYAEGTLRRMDVNGDGTCNNSDDGRGALLTTQACWGRANEQEWQVIWQNLRVSWVAWQLYARALGTSNSTRTNTYNTWMANFTSQTNVANMDTTLQQSCTLARNNGVVVFGIAFEAPVNGQTQIAGCATSPSHYYNAQGLEISSAFRAIANQINALRLIQ